LSKKTGFVAVLNDSKILRNIVDSIVTLVDEGTFVVDDRGLHLTEMDPAKVAMVSVDLPDSDFDKFSVDTRTLFRVDLDELKKVVAPAGTGDSVTISLDAGANQLKLQFRGATTRTFKLGLREVQEKEPKKLDIPFQAHLKIIPSNLNQIVKDAQLFSDSIQFHATKDQFITRAKGTGSIGNTEAVFKKDSEPIIEYKVTEEAEASYALNYLSDMVKIASASESVLLEFSTRVPLTLEFSLVGGGTIKYVLAPRRE
jgi:proliferating cell nuclear antigen